jgi:hypothetical protein
MRLQSAGTALVELFFPALVYTVGEIVLAQGLRDPCLIRLLKYLQLLLYRELPSWCCHSILNLVTKMILHFHSSHLGG